MITLYEDTEVFEIVINDNHTLVIDFISWIVITPIIYMRSVTTFLGYSLLNNFLRIPRK